MDEYELLQIEQFLTKAAATGNEFIPVGENGTFKIRAYVLVQYIAEQRGYITGASLTPINSNLTQLNTDVAKKVDKSSIVNNLNSTSGTAVLSAAQGRILKGIIDGFASQVGTGIIGEAIPTTEPITEGFGIYTVSTPGVYVNFLDINGDQIEVFEADLVNGLVQLWGNDGVWEKQVTQVNSNDPESSETGFVQVPQ